MQELFSDGAKETRAVLTELFETTTYHPQRRSPAELASDVVRELAFRGLLKVEGADGQDEPMPAWDPDSWVREGDRLKAEHEEWMDAQTNPPDCI